MELRAEGAAELGRLAAQLRKLGRGQLDQKLRRGLTKAVKPLGPVIVASMPQYLPDNYAAVLGPASRFAVSTRTTRGNVWVRFGMESHGQAEHRDIPRINQGLLRKPVFGRFSRIKRGGRGGVRVHPWVTQRVRPGFFDEPAAEHVDTLTLAAFEVLTDIAREIANG